MNTTAPEAKALVEGILDADAALFDAVEVLMCPPFTNLAAVTEKTAGTAVHVGGQNMHEAEKGAFTGEISAAMLTALGCSHVILGHSERRQYFHETDVLIHQKLVAALAAGLTPVVCIGETLDEREQGRASDVVATQVNGALGSLSAEEAAKLVWAYEPVWAIGTGKTATPDQAQTMHADIRALLAAQFGDAEAQKVRILYGGSMNAANAAELLAQPDIDGGLIGGASLKAQDFLTIIRAASAA